MTFALRIGGKLGFKRLCAGKSPGGIPAGMGTESRSIPAVTHIADKQGAIWVAQMHFGFKIPVIHHPGSEISADQGDAGSLFNFQGLGRNTSDTTARDR